MKQSNIKNPSENPFCFSLPNLTAFANEINIFLSLFIRIFQNISFSLSAILNVFQRFNEKFYMSMTRGNGLNRQRRVVAQFLRRYLPACNFWTLKSSINFIYSYISPEDETTFKYEHKSIYDQMSLLSIVTKILAMLAIAIMNQTSNKYHK